MQNDKEIEFGKSGETAVIMSVLCDSTEAAAHLSVSKDMLKKLRHRRLVPFIKLGHKTVRFKKEDLDAYLSRVRVGAVWEMESKKSAVVGRDGSSKVREVSK